MYEHYTYKWSHCQEEAKEPEGIIII